MSILAHDAREMANQLLAAPLFRPPVAMAWSAPVGQVESDSTINRGLMERRRIRARQYACLLARQHAVDLETVGRSISPHDVEVIAGIAINTYIRKTGGQRAQSSAEGGER